MGNVYAIGEIVYDIIFRNSQPQQANPGGSMLNSAVSLSRTGLPVFFIGETGNDEVGNIIKSFLSTNKVKIDYIQSYSNNKSSIALAFLDEKNDASYVFHKDYPKQRLTIDLPIPTKGDIVLFGSSFALNNDVRPALLSFLKNASKNGAIILYDPNFRKQASDKKVILEMVKENISMADIVRGSDEDFQNLFEINNDSTIYSLVKENACKYLIITKNKDGVILQNPTEIQQINVPQINTVSTIGAGDNFNAGLIYGLLNRDITIDNLEEISSSNWQDIIENAIAFSSHVCSSYDNYISQEFAGKYSIEK